MKFQSCPKRFASSTNTVQSSLASPGASTALRSSCTARVVLVHVPDFSGQHAAGRTTSAFCAVSVGRYPVRQGDQLSRAWETWFVSASVTMGFTHDVSALSSPFPQLPSWSRQESALPLLGSCIPRASIFSAAAGDRPKVAGECCGKAPHVACTCTLFCPRAVTPVPGRPSIPKGQLQLRTLLVPLYAV